jgi:hypothetical protein
VLVAFVIRDVLLAEEEQAPAVVRQLRRFRDSRGQCRDHYFLQLGPIFGVKTGYSLENRGNILMFA